MAVEKRRVAVVHGVFMLDGNYTSPGQVVTDPEQVDFCLSTHRDKVVPSMHDFDEAGRDLGEDESER